MAPDPCQRAGTRAAVVAVLGGVRMGAMPDDTVESASPTVSPLAAILPERSTPGLSSLQARFAGLISSGISAALLGELFPLGRPLHVTALGLRVQAKRGDVGRTSSATSTSVITGCSREWAQLPRPDLPLLVGLDGGYVPSSTRRSRRDGWFDITTQLQRLTWFLWHGNTFPALQIIDDLTR